MLQDFQALALLTLIVRHAGVFAVKEEPTRRKEFQALGNEILFHRNLADKISLNDCVGTYLSSSALSLKTDDTDSAGILLYYASSEALGCEPSKLIIIYDPQIITIY